MAEYIPEHGSRRDRMHNNAVWFEKKYKVYKSQGVGAISASRMRDEIREALGLPILDRGESRWGDVRAHTDAAGGHGLHLAKKKIQGKTCILLTDENYKKCLDYLKGEDNPTVLF